MAQRVVAVDLDVSWEPNAPEAVLAKDDLGRACLAVMPHFEDGDERPVVLVWEGCAAAEMGPPNDEALHRHPLYDSGLRGLLGLGEVLESERIAMTAGMLSRPPAHHFVVPLKECMVEVLADGVAVRRCSGTTAEAAFAALEA